MRMMNRRRFLGATAAAIASGGAATRASFGAQGGAILGQGGHRYRVEQGWGVLDAAKTPVKDCHWMVQASKGRIILLTNHTSNNVIIYDRSGKLLETWGTEYPGAHGLALCDENGEEFLFITDSGRHQIYKTTLSGRVVMTLDYPKDSDVYDNAEQYKPTDLAIAPNGDLTVADGYGKSYAIQYDSGGKVIRVFGGEPILSVPHGVCFDRRDADNPVLIFASRKHEALKRFTLEGEYLDTIPMPGAEVCDVQQYKDRLFVAHLNGFVSILDRNNRVVSNLGAAAPRYDEQGNLTPMEKDNDLFTHPHSILVDDEGCVYVPQWNSNQTYPIKLRPIEA